MVLSDRALRHLARLKEAHREAVQATGREPTREQLAQRAGLDLDQVDDLLAVERTPKSLEEPANREDGEIGTFGELLVDPMAEGEYERVLSAIQTEELHGLLAGLSDRERDVLRGRYGFADGDDRSLRQIGDELGLSSERVRQIERRALGKLAAAMAPARRPDGE
jgi:RNA polymerase sigma factor (sigma-70 family)